MISPELLSKSHIKFPWMKYGEEDAKHFRNLRGLWVAQYENIQPIFRWTIQAYYVSQYCIIDHVDLLVFHGVIESLRY